MLANPKHEAFAQAVAAMDGTPAHELYRRHVSSTGTVKTSQEGASRLMASRKIAARIEGLKGAVERVANDEFGLSRQSWLARLLALADKAEQGCNFSAAIAALAQIGKSCGWYAPVKDETQPVDTLAAFIEQMRAR